MSKTLDIPVPKQPSYREHKASGQAVVTLPDGLGRRRDVLLGKYGTEASRAAYDRVVAEWLANGRRLAKPTVALAGGLTVNELLVAFFEKAEAEGRPQTWIDEFVYAARPLKQLYGDTAAAKFGPLSLEAVRDRIVASGLCRSQVNRRVQRIRRVFQFGVARELIPATILHALEAVEGLRRGLTKAPESVPIRPVPDAFVDAIRPHVGRHVWGLVEIMRVTGMRPAEACMMRACDLDMNGPVWLYTPQRHKTEHHGHSRTVVIGPKGQVVLREFLTMDTEAYLFSPRVAMEERRAKLRADRQSPVQPSQ
jgi:integrase